MLNARPCQRRRVLEVADVAGTHRRRGKSFDRHDVVGGDLHHITAFGAHRQLLAN
jgi:hypothetical protein